MEVIDRRDFSLGWQPGLDSLNGDPRSLLRADNLVQDEEGILSTRFGYTSMTTLATGEPIHTFMTAVLDGQRFRFAGAGDDFWVSFPGLGGGFTRRDQLVPQTTDPDIAMGTGFNQVFYARGVSKRKYDGLEVGGDNGAGNRNWGIAAPTGVATVSILDADETSFSNFNDGDGFVADDGEIQVVADKFDVDNRAVEVIPSEAGTATITKDYGQEVDFTLYDGGQRGVDEDSICLYASIQFPDQIEYITMMIDCNGDSAKLFTDDFYYFDFFPNMNFENKIDPAQILKPGMRDRGDVIGYDREVFKQRIQRGTYRDYINIRPGTGPFENNAQWQQLRVHRGSMKRFGSSTGKDWRTIRAIRLVIKVREDLPDTSIFGTVKFDDWFIKGGAQRALTGEYKVRFQYLYNSGLYRAKSPLSDESEAVIVENCGLRARIPAPSDPQVNEIDVFVMGGFMDRYYKFATTTQTSGNIQVNLVLSDRDAIERNEFAETNIVGPPDGIIDIIAPHYGRLIAVTKRGIHPSLVGDPESFNPGHVAQPFDSTETIVWARKMGTGIAVATTRDIYAYEGTGAENIDGTINFRLRPLNTGAGAASRDFAQEGDALFHLASDGWRVFDGASSRPLKGSVDLLYKGYSRYGVTGANLGSAPGRFRCCIFNNYFYCMFSTDGPSPEVHRYDIKNNLWNRFIYPVSINHLYREPDGKILAAGGAGQVYQIENGSTDDGADIEWEYWTAYDNGNDPRVSKEMFDYRAFVSGANLVDPVPLSYLVDLYVDGDDSTPAASLSSTFTGTSDLIWQSPLTVNDAVRSFRRLQSRASGSGRVRILGYGFTFRPRPLPMRFWDSGLIDTGYNDITWIGQVDVKIRTDVVVEIQIWFDETLFGTYDVPALFGIARPYTVNTPRNFFGYQPRIVVRCKGDTGTAVVADEGFEMYWTRFKFRESGRITDKSAITVVPSGAYGHAKQGKA
jgi:hypothetical protein